MGHTEGHEKMDAMLSFQCVISQKLTTTLVTN